jgi:hypothetical protein
MSNQAVSIRERFGEFCNSESVEQDEWVDTPPKSKMIKKRIEQHVKQLFAFVEKRRDPRSFDEVERATIPLIFALGRLFFAYYLAWRHEHAERACRRLSEKCYETGEPQARMIGTHFGRVRYWRTYFRRRGGGGGVYALDLALKLTTDGFSMSVMGIAARLATLMPFDRVTDLLVTFMLWSPSKTTVEKAVLGLGRYTTEWFEEAPAPEGDGEVLVIQIDSKATPTATDSELAKRRGKRRANAYPDSPRHRGRDKRRRRGSKPRRKKGDKSKNGKATTLVVMYTLKMATDNRGRPILKGPLNRKVYASYAPKRHAFAIARREADKRGFTQESGKMIQLVTDGDDDLEGYARDFLPEAIHTLDLMHAMEYVWNAGRSLYREGSDELTKWAKGMKDLLCRGEAKKVVARITKCLQQIPKTGPGNKKKRERVEKAVGYLGKRVHMMNYDWLIAEDLEIASGSVEGAVNYVIATRFDNGGMRWIRQRSEALLQLRCIEINGDWDSFISFVQNKLAAKTTQELERQTLLTTEQSPLPTFGIKSIN